MRQEIARGGIVNWNPLVPNLTAAGVFKVIGYASRNSLFFGRSNIQDPTRQTENMWVRYISTRHKREKNGVVVLRYLFTFEHSFAEEWGATSRRPFLRGTAVDISAGIQPTAGRLRQRPNCKRHKIPKGTKRARMPLTLCLEVCEVYIRLMATTLPIAMDLLASSTQSMDVLCLGFTRVLTRLFFSSSTYVRRTVPYFYVLQKRVF